MLSLYFIRHGQSENNALWERTGSSQGRSEDPALTSIGRKQAEAAGLYLSQLYEREQMITPCPSQKITHIYTSLMLRAVETATIINRYLKLPLHAWVEIHEGGGIYLDDPITGKPRGLPGKDRAFFEKHFPELHLPENLNHQGWWDNRPYEEPYQVLERAKSFVKQLIERHGNTDDCVAIVSHGDFYQRVMSVLLRIPTHYYHRDFPERTVYLTQQPQEVIQGLPPHCWFVLNNAGISRIDFQQDYVEFVYLNRIDFLPKNLIT